MHVASYSARQITRPRSRRRRRTGAYPLATLELEGASVDRRIESDADGSLMDKPTRARILTVYAIAPDADPGAVRSAALNAARDGGWHLEDDSAEVVNGTRALPAGQAEIAIYFSVDYSSGEATPVDDELIIALEHEWRP